MSLVNVSYCSKFHVNIITGSRVMTIFLYKELTRNSKIGNTHAWVLPKIWGLGQAKNCKFCTNVFNEMWLNPAKCQDYSYNCFWVIKGKPTFFIALDIAFIFPFTLPKNRKLFIRYFHLYVVLHIKLYYKNNRRN